MRPFELFGVLTSGIFTPPRFVAVPFGALRLLRLFAVFEAFGEFISLGRFPKPKIFLIPLPSFFKEPKKMPPINEPSPLKIAPNNVPSNERKISLPILPPTLETKNGKNFVKMPVSADINKPGKNFNKVQSQLDFFCLPMRSVSSSILPNRFKSDL